MNDTIERIEPMKVHKNIVIQMLREHPEEWRNFIEGEGITDAASAIAFLEAQPFDWIHEILEAHGGTVKK